MIPLELLTMVGSGLLSAFMTLWSLKMKYKQAQQEWMIKGLAARSKAIQEAREYKDKGFQFTRRLIALSSVFAIIVLPKLVAIWNPEVLVLVGYTEFNPGFWPFTDGADVIKWRPASGLVITPLDTHLVSAIVGLYFGASMVKNA